MVILEVIVDPIAVLLASEQPQNSRYRVGNQVVPGVR